MKGSDICEKITFGFFGYGTLVYCFRLCSTREGGRG